MSYRAIVGGNGAGSGGSNEGTDGSSDVASEGGRPLSETEVEEAVVTVVEAAAGVGDVARRSVATGDAGADKESGGGGDAAGDSTTVGDALVSSSSSVSDLARSRPSNAEAAARAAALETSPSLILPVPREASETPVVPCFFGGIPRGRRPSCALRTNG